jgi:predicted acyltransferase
MSPALPSGAERSLALDVMRGLTVALMIVVNMSLSEQLSYGQLLHARWHGFTLTDLVFPSFLFIVGAAMAFSLDRAAQAGRSAAFARVLRRSALLFGCGLLLYYFPFVQVGSDGAWSMRPLASARIPGVLQRIALCQALAAAVLLWGGRRGAIAFSVIALLGTWAVLVGCGDLTLAGNAARRLDLWLFGAGHIYQGEGLPYDPEGLLGTAAATVHVLAGYGATRWLRAAPAQPLARLVVVGAATVGLALAWDALLPINKKLWTPSYVALSIGLDLLILAALTELIDRRGRRRGLWVLQVFGLNPLAIYLLSEVGNAVLWLTPMQGTTLMEWLYQQGFHSWAGDKPGSLLYALAYTAACWLPGWWLWRRGIVVRL